MTQPAKQAPIIDAHMHLGHMQRSDWALLKTLTLDEIIAVMDRYGVEKGFFSAYASFLWRPEEGNEITWAAMRKHPSRVMGYIGTNPRCGRKAVEEIQRRYEQGFRGLKLGPIYNDYSLTDSFVFPVVEKALELDLPMLIHIGHECPENLPGMLARYPQAKVIVAHLWGVERRAPIVTAYENVRWEISGAGQVRGDLERAVRLVGAEKLLFGSDLSICYMAASLMSLQKSSLSEAEKELILHENARRFFRL